MPLVDHATGPITIMVELEAEIDVEAHPLLSREAIAAMADRMGLKLVAKTPDDLTAEDHHRLLDRLEAPAGSPALDLAARQGQNVRYRLGRPFSEMEGDPAKLEEKRNLTRRDSDLKGVSSDRSGSKL